MNNKIVSLIGVCFLSCFFLLIFFHDFGLKNDYISSGKNEIQIYDTNKKRIDFLSEKIEKDKNFKNFINSQENTELIKKQLQNEEQIKKNINSIITEDKSEKNNLLISKIIDLQKLNNDTSNKIKKLDSLEKEYFNIKATYKDKLKSSFEYEKAIPSFNSSIEDFYKEKNRFKNGVLEEELKDIEIVFQVFKENIEKVKNLKDDNFENILKIYTYSKSIEEDFENLNKKINEFKRLINELDTYRTKKIIEFKTTPQYVIAYFNVDSSKEPIIKDYDKPENSVLFQEVDSLTFSRFNPSLDSQIIIFNNIQMFAVDAVKDFKYEILIEESNEKGVSSKNWNEIDEKTYKDLYSIMKDANDNSLIIEQKAKGQFESEASTVPYPAKYGNSYAHIGDENYGHYDNNGNWNFNSFFLGYLMGNSGNSYSSGGYVPYQYNGGYYNKSNYDRDLKYYKTKGYDTELYDRSKKEKYTFDKNYKSNPRTETIKEIKTELKKVSTIKSDTFKSNSNIKYKAFGFKNTGNSPIKKIDLSNNKAIFKTSEFKSKNNIKYKAFSKDLTSKIKSNSNIMSKISKSVSRGGFSSGRGSSSS